MKRVYLLLAVFLLNAFVARAQDVASPDPYANETKEQRAERMAWWHEARFGMFIHWGVYAVPGRGPNATWYPYNMYREGTEQHAYHVQTYGGPAKFGYKDFIPMFTGENFDAGEWAELFAASGEIELNAGLPTVTIYVANTGDRPIQVGSHYHFFETNKGLDFDRDQARGMRLDIPSGTAVRFEPGQKRTVQLIPLSGKREVYGFRQLVMGKL